MTDLEKIRDMLNKQDELNCLTNGDDWKSGLTNKGKTINWLRCIRREAMELCDSYPWEHWKAIGKEPDIDNALIETTDIWFFTMSYILSKNNNMNESLAMSMVSTFNEKLLTKNTNIPELTDDLIGSTYNSKIMYDQSYLLYKFTKIMDALDMDLNLLYKLYNGKLVLNKFRQDNGYKEGTYCKIWKGKEDNVHMLEIIRTNKDINNEILYNALTNRYNTLTIGV
jgi:hypothetical protein